MTKPQAETLLAITLKFAGLGIKGAQFLRLEEGPIVTTYYFKPSHSTPISKFMGKEEDIAVSTESDSVLIHRDGGNIAISIANKERIVVNFDNCMYKMQTDPDLTKQKLPLMIGVDTRGNPSSLDLSTQPHLLIAGQTGGGKSVLLASFIAGLVTKLSPRELQLITVDTKKLDLPLFSELPHVSSSIDSVEKFHEAMNTLMQLVRDRTTQMQGIARNIDEWNQLGLKHYAYHVLIIDELADLIDGDNDLHANKIEPYCNYPKVQARLKSLLQICRAAGVHVICATQRSSVKVINGDIKANLPTRIALRLPSRFDSSCILSGAGAEQLLGKGDMLIESADTATATRYHGAFVDMNHIARIINQHESIRDSFVAIREQVLASTG